MTRKHQADEDSFRAIEMLLDDRVHLALASSEPADARLAFERFGVERLLAVAAPPNAKRILGSRNLAQALNAEPYVTYDLDGGLLRSWLIANDLPIPGRVPAVVAPDLAVLRAAACRGLGWAVLPDYLTASHREAGDLKEITPPLARPERRHFLVWAKTALRHPRVVFARDTLLRTFRGNEVR